MTRGNVVRQMQPGADDFRASCMAEGVLRYFDPEMPKTGCPVLVLINLDLFLHEKQT